MSSPPEPSTSIFSGLSAVIEIGTSWMFSSRRCAVTVMVSSTEASPVSAVGSAFCASVGPNGSASAMAKVRAFRRSRAWVRLLSVVMGRSPEQNRRLRAAGLDDVSALRAVVAFRRARPARPAGPGARLETLRIS